MFFYEMVNSLEDDLIKWVPENLYTFTIWTAIEKVYLHVFCDSLYFLIENVNSFVDDLIFCCQALYKT